MSTMRGPELGKWKGRAQASPVVPQSLHSSQGSALPLRREDRNQQVTGDTWGHCSCPAVRISSVQVCSRGNLVWTGVALSQPSEPAEQWLFCLFAFWCFFFFFFALEKSWFVCNLHSVCPCIYLGQLWPQRSYFLIYYLFIYFAALSLCCDTGDLHCSVQAYSSCSWDSLVMAFWLSCSLASGILVLWPRIKPAPPALEGRFLTIGLSGKSQDQLLNRVGDLPSFIKIWQAQER